MSPPPGGLIEIFGTSNCLQVETKLKDCDIKGLQGRAHIHKNAQLWVTLAPCNKSEN